MTKEGKYLKTTKKKYKVKVDGYVMEQVIAFTSLGVKVNRYDKNIPIRQWFMRRKIPIGYVCNVFSTQT